MVIYSPCVFRGDQFSVIVLNVIAISVIGTSVDWEVSLQVGSAGPSHLLPPGWYIEDPRDSILLGNLPINALDEWDVAKLGKLDPFFT